VVSCGYGGEIRTNVTDSLSNGKEEAEKSKKVEETDNIIKKGGKEKTYIWIFNLKSQSAISTTQFHLVHLEEERMG